MLGGNEKEKEKERERERETHTPHTDLESPAGHLPSLPNPQTLGSMTASNSLSIKHRVPPLNFLLFSFKCSFKEDQTSSPLGTAIFFRSRMAIMIEPGLLPYTWAVGFVSVRVAQELRPRHGREAESTLS